MLLSKGAREDAIKSLINYWLHDTTPMCGWCQERYDEINFPCCEQPFIATHGAIYMQFLKELRMTRETQDNDFASNKDKTLRLTLSFPPGLLSFLEVGFKAQYGEELINKEYDINWFARHFPQFTIPRKI